MQTRFGELLTQVSNLSSHDIEEILHEQRHSGQRFGQVALTFGFCTPEHIWQAWSAQLVDRHERVCLEEIGIDAQAVAEISPELAWLHGIIPVRSFSHELIIATAETHNDSLCEMLSRILEKNVRAVFADADDIERMLKEYYPLPTSR